MNPIINNTTMRKGTFKGEPNGFVALPQGSLFRRRYYEYKIMVKGQQWKTYEGVYYEPNPREYENDSNETLWFKTTGANDRFGWVKLPPSPQDDDIYLILVGDGIYLADEESESNTTFVIYN